MLDVLKDRPQTTGDLCARFPALDRCTVMQHLKVLEAAGLVRSEKVGRVRTCRVEPAALTAAERWLNDRRRSVERSLDRLGAFLDETKSETET